MALKPDRKITDGTDISFFMNQTAERGIALKLSTGGSGAAMDDASALAAKPAAAHGSGEYILGVLMNDVVSGDLTKTHLNYQKDEVQVGGKVTICRRGTVTTNMIEGTPAAGMGAYVGTLGTDGKITGIAVTGFQDKNSNIFFAQSGNALTRIGTWLSSKDADGYAKLDVNLV
jgi:hypothetical protein